MKAAQYLGDAKFGVVPSTHVPPKEGEVSLDVGYVGICGTDMHIYHGAMDHRVCPPNVIGHEMSGTVREVGEGVTGYAPGDKVVVRPLDYCGDCPACDAGHSHICHNLNFMGIDTAGALQSSWTVKARTLHKLPDNIDLRTGAIIEPLSVACHDVTRAGVKSGEDVVILGGGPIGQLIAQVAKAKGANVLISEINETRLKFSTDNGIDTINPAKDDIVKAVMERTNGKGADVVFEVAGVMPAVKAMTDIAAVRGRICIVAIHSKPAEIDLFKFFWRELEMVGARVYEAADYDEAIELIASGKLNVEPFFTGEFTLDQVGDAFHALDTNPTGMKYIINCGGHA